MSQKEGCPNCSGHRIVRGELKGVKGDKPTFIADETKSFKVSYDNPTISYPGPVYLCIDCGLLWSIVNVSIAKKKLSSWGTWKFKKRLDLEEDT